MPVLANPRHEIFVQSIVKGVNPREAYKSAGYDVKSEASADVSASRLLSSDKIKTRIAEIQSRSAEKVEVSVASLINEAELVRVAAMECGQLSAAIAAIKEKGVLSGKRIEKQETGKPGDFSRMNDDELREFVASRARAIGVGVSRTGIAGSPESSIGSRRLN